MAELIPREVLFGNPERVSPQISPDGSQLAWIAPRDGVLNVWVAPISPSGDSDESGVDWAAAKVVTDDTDRGIRMFAWARDGRHLLYLQDTGGDENWRLYDVDLATMARRDLTPFDGIQARIVATRKSHRDEVLVGINRDNPQLHDVYRLSLTSGELEKLIDNPGYAGWIADEDMVVRGAISPLPDGGFDMLVRDGADDDWRTLLTIPADDVAASDVLAFTGDGRSLLAISSIEADTGRLVRIDLGSGAAEVLAEDPEELRAAVGLSRAKVGFLRSLANHIIDGELELDRMNELPDEEVVAELVAVKGIGEWTAHMFLLFHLDRPDVLAVGDLGIRAAMRRLYELPELPSPAEMERIAEPWRPYRSTACRFLWRSLDNEPA
jgi:hypothetical protein